MDWHADEDGYALLTAVIAMAILAALSITLIQASRGTLDGVAAEIERARLQADADAALVLAVHQLTLTERFRRWSIDGRPHHLRFDGADLAIGVEDERGKIPLNQIDDDQVRTLFAALGVEEPQLDEVVASFLDWRDADDDVRPHGAESAYYAPLGRRPRNGSLHSFAELLDVRGMTPALVARLRPIASVMGGAGEGFDERYAQPLAVRIMGGSEVTVLERQRELSGDRPALSLNDADMLIGRALTIRVEVHDHRGGDLTQSTIIQLTGKPARPVLIRAQE